MKYELKSPGSATIVNAIATGFGSAFGIDLDITCKGFLTNSEIKCFNDVGASNALMERCVNKYFDLFNISKDDYGVSIKTKSNLPMASGLSSSSALSNGVIALINKMFSVEFEKPLLSDLEIINLAIEASLEENVTITGAFDDATASYFGGITLTDNKQRKIIFKENIRDYCVLIFMPDYISESGKSDVFKMKLFSPLVNIAFDLASSGKYFDALNLNGLLYSSALGFDFDIALNALNKGALASGLSGTGSSFVAICEDSTIDDIKEVWSVYEGNIIESRTNNKGCFFK